MKERYTKNIGVLTEAELAALFEKKIFIAGCGGLGSYMLEMFARLGVRHISLADDDIITICNLNRQLYATEKNLGEHKTKVAVHHTKKVNHEVNLEAFPVRMDEGNAEILMKDHDIIMDAFDNIPSRLLLEKTAEKLKIPLVHGAINGWIAQIALVMPGDRTLEKLYEGDNSGPTSDPTFTPALCASLQVSQAVKFLTGKKTLAKGQVLKFNLLDHATEILSI
jgi:molybdopterin/thiamine biosynthesis adenylyltransferase